MKHLAERCEALHETVLSLDWSATNDALACALSIVGEVLAAVGDVRECVAQLAQQTGNPVLAARVQKGGA